MSDIAASLIALVIVLFGLSFMIWGSAGPGKLIGAILAPFGCLLKIVAGLVVIGIGVLLFVDQPTWLPNLRNPLPTTPIPSPGPASAPGVQSQDVLFTEYPLLAQRDRSLYSPPELADETYWHDGRAYPISTLACLATVYLILERGRGASNAMLTNASFDSNYDAVNPGYVATADMDFNANRFMREVREGRPVVLHAEGGVLDHHFVLGVGLRRRADGGWTGIANDPWFGQRIEIDLGQSAPGHPSLSGTAFTMMRLVD